MNEHDHAGEGHEVFGPYEVYERLGVGGMATVHRAKERGIEDFERIVALKRLLPHLAEDESFVRSFVREAKLASMLHHANIIQIYELGRVGHVYFISMEYVEGRDIRKLLRQSKRVTGPPPVNVVIALLVQLCDALDYAHHRRDEHGQPLGLVHRDVSPSNLLVTHSGHLKIIDFGIAKAQSMQLRTQTGRVKGKLAYMAPEAIRGLTLDRRSDIFSCGVIAHELLTARPLFASKNDYQTLMRVQKAQVAPPSVHNADCPSELDHIVLQALEKDRDRRFGSMAEMRDALHAIRQHYQYSSTNREIASWMEWAFATEAPPTASRRPMTISQSHSAVSSSAIPRPLGTSSSSGVVRRPMTAGDRTPAPALHPQRQHAGAAMPPVDDEEVVEIAWGNDAENAPVLLEDVPDVSHKRPGTQGGVGLAMEQADDGAAAAHLAATMSGAASWPRGTRPPTVPAEVPPLPRARAARGTRPGTQAELEEYSRSHSMAAAPAPRRGRTIGLMLLAMLAAGAAVAVLMLTRGRGGEAALTEPAPLARVKLVVQPDDATISIEGRDPHPGSPYTLQLDDGTYMVEVRRDGYQSWISAIEIARGENQTIHVVLNAADADDGQAHLAIRTTPPGQRVMIDGTELSERTPVDVDVEPGPHTIVIPGQLNELWRHEIDARAATQYEFQPDLEAAIREDEKRVRRHERREQERLAAETDTDEAVIQYDDPARGTRRAAPRAAGTVAAELGPLALRTEEPPEAPKRRRTEPVVVPPGTVAKLSGNLPTIRTDRDDELRDKVAVLKVCIDVRGAVTSATTLSKMPRDVAETIEKALRSWRYRPHLLDGERVPACFVVNFRLQ